MNDFVIVKKSAEYRFAFFEKLILDNLENLYYTSKVFLNLLFDKRIEVTVSGSKYNFFKIKDHFQV